MEEEHADDLVSLLNEVGKLDRGAFNADGELLAPRSEMFPLSPVNGREGTMRAAKP